MILQVQRECITEQFGGLLVVESDGAGGGRGSDVAADILGHLVLSTDLSDGSREREEHVSPGTHVLVLLLCPNDGGLGVFGQFGHGGLEGEGSELFDAYNGHIVDSLLLSLVYEGVVNLARAEDDSADLLVGHEGRGDLRDDELESLVFSLVVEGSDVRFA